MIYTHVISDTKPWWSVSGDVLGQQRNPRARTACAGTGEPAGDCAQQQGAGRRLAAADPLNDFDRRPTL
tara:strand:- start:1454 stop:1660 length:207 start_codon:yes stop_codon:yes gene_type:complete